MNFLDSKPKIEAEDLTYSGKENRYIVNKKYNRKLDYAFIFDPSKALKTEDSERVLHHIPISDHFGWKCRIYK